VLEALAEAGILSIARREGNRRLYDLTARLYPPALLADRSRTPREQHRHRLLSRYRAHGLHGAAEVWLGTGPARPSPMEPDRPTRAELLAELLAAGELVHVSVEGVPGECYVLAAERPVLDAAEREIAAGRPPGGTPPRAAFLAPLDPLLWDRQFVRGLDGFDYVWEVYVPARKRRWGYNVLPILFGDRLVGRIEPRIDP
jgi:uncharacterized protein YcaQ